MAMMVAMISSEHAVAQLVLRTEPKIIAAVSLPQPQKKTIDRWMAMKPIKATSPTKCRLRAHCRPPHIWTYHGNLASIAGDWAAPVRIWNGASTKTTLAYASFCMASKGSPGSNGGKLNVI
jgi:hypothetical protein